MLTSSHWLIAETQGSQLQSCDERWVRGTLTLRQRETRLKAELESLSTQLADQATYLRLAHTLGEFLERLRTQVRSLDVLERQRVVRLLVVNAG
jgi:hypothetical protein